MTLKHFIVGTAVIVGIAFGLSTGASALVVDDLGTLTVPTAGVNSGNNSTSGTLPSSGSFVDQYEFQVSTDANLQEITTVLNNVGNINLATLEVTLWEGSATGVGNDPTGSYTTVLPLTTATQGANPFQYIFTLAYLGLSASTPYFIQVAGDIIGTSGGNYSVLVSVSNVPLPPAIWLFISALIGLVSIARTRRNGTVA